MTLKDLNTRTGRRALLAYGGLWGGSTLYLAMRGADWVFPIASLLIFGGMLSTLCWFLTRKMDAPPLTIANPRIETLGLLAFLLVYAVVFLGWAFGPIKAVIPSGQLHALWVLAVKLLVHVVLPSGLILMLGGSIRSMWRAGMGQRGFWIALIPLGALLFGLMALVTPALSQIAGLHLTLPVALLWVLGAWFWVSLEAGLCEEYLFRAGLQSRLSAWLQSPVAAIIITSLTFALCHAPGLYLRGTPDTDGYSTDPLQVIAFTIATLSPISIALGLLWERSRSLLLVVLLHGAIDALPFTTEFVKIWS